MSITGLCRGRSAVLAITALVLTVLAGCGDDSTAAIFEQQRAEQLSADARSDTTAPAADGDATPAPTVEPTGVVVPVMALDNSFRPTTVEVKVGDEVLWENRGMNDHDVLEVAGERFGVHIDGFGPGAVYSHVFTEPGEYRYFCSIHGNEDVGMVGTVVVTS